MMRRLAVNVRTWSRTPFLQDAVLAAAILAVCVLVNSPNSVVRRVAGGALDGAASGEVLLWWAATALAVVSVALRRHQPLLMLALATLSVASHIAQAVPTMIIDMSGLVLLYTVAVRYRRVVSVMVLAGLLLLVTGWSLDSAVNARPTPGFPAVIPTTSAGQGSGGPGPAPISSRVAVDQDAWSGPLALGSALLAAWAMGAGARSRRAYLDQLHARAHDLERERDQQAALAVAAERGRISRELHDVVAHGLSVMVTQAQGATAALDHRPADSRAALEAIVRTGRDSLADMRLVLASVDGVDDAWHPQPGLNQLSTLAAQVTEAGTPVRVRVEGGPAALPSAVDLSAYRIVQEALTNTMKHAGAGASAEVVLGYRGAELTIEVSDNGRGTASNGGGNGLRGMHERARLLGGRVTAGHRPADGGFVVQATLPIDGPGA